MLLLTSAAAVIFMLFGLALFYAGQTDERSIVNTLLMSVGAFAIVLPLWTLWGFGIAYTGLAYSADLVLFSGAFAVIATALVSGSVAGRMKFSSWMIFAGIWSIVVYSILALWTWNPTGWLYTLGAIDLAGGGPIHIAAGISGLVLALVLGKRGGHTIRHNVPLVILGAGILTFGWIFFNAGSTLVLGALTYEVALNTMLAAATGALAWFGLDMLRHKRATALSGASGLVAGLVAITPAAAVLVTWEAALLGAAAALAVYAVLTYKDRLPVDDALDVAAFHGIAGIVGSLGIGVALGWSQLGTQAIAVGATVGFAGIVTLVIALLIKYTIGLRISEPVEVDGIDSLHSINV
jgi:ammonium transporter, Amt family